MLPRALRDDRAAALLLQELVEQAASGVRDRLGVSYGVHAAVAEFCGAEMLVLTGTIDREHASAGVLELRRGLEALRGAAGLAAYLPGAQRRVITRLLGDLADRSSVAARLAELAARDLPPTRSATTPAGSPP